MWIEVINNVTEGDDIRTTTYGETTVRIFDKWGKKIYSEVRKWHWWPTSKASQIIAYRGNQGSITNKDINDAIMLAYNDGVDAYIQV